MYQTTISIFLLPVNDVPHSLKAVKRKEKEKHALEDNEKELGEIVR